MIKYHLRLLSVVREIEHKKEVIRVKRKISDSYRELMQQKQRRQFLTGRNGVNCNAEEFMTKNPVVSINTERLFSHLSQYYDRDFENDVYDDIVDALERSRTER